VIIKTFVEGPIDANNYLVIDEKTNEGFLVDCSSPREEFINAIKNSGINLKYIFLTHGHFDHILGVDKFKEVFGTKVFISKDDLSQVEYLPTLTQMFLGAKSQEIKTKFDFVTDGDEFQVGNLKIKAISTAGHTKGGMSYLVEDKLFSGDTLFRYSVGRCDLPEGDYGQIKNSVKNKLFVLPDKTEVFTGHGEKTTIGFEKKYNEILNI
jgi:glyoxylase-like metal-dependent hydrolase (beta-lactamase superfamily II)